MSLLDLIQDSKRPPAIVAELSGNHQQNFELAEKLVRLAHDAGADAIKLQTYTADSLTMDSPGDEFLIPDGLWQGNRLHRLYETACTPYHWHGPLKRLADELGIHLFSTPFDETAVDFLETTIDPELYKISSFEVTHLPLLERVGQTGKPVAMSTGMASVDEIAEALATLKASGCPQVVLLKCVSAYPAAPADFNLRSMPAMESRFHCPVGLSDHTLGNEVALAATALGARLLEKHFVESRSGRGVDAAFSVEPIELANLVAQVKRVHCSLGNSAIESSPQEIEQRRYRRSIYVGAPIRAGETFTSTNLKIIRPANGLPPKDWYAVLGKTANRDLSAGTPLLPNDVKD